MNEFEQQEAAQAPVQPYRGEYPGKVQRRVIAGLITGFVVIILVVGAVLFVNMNNKIQHLDRTVTAQASQIHHLETNLITVNASLGAAVACLQTVGSLSGLCSKLVK